MPKISIITPVYVDIEPKIIWLNEMIQSVLSQIITDWELILIDDKSPLSDLISGVMSQYANDGRLRWLENAANEGPAKTRNTAVALAESDCILPLDSDDMLASDDVLEQMYQVWQQDKKKIIYGNLQQLVLSGQNSFTKGRVFSLGAYSFEGVMNLEGLMPVTCMHSVECHQAAGGWKHELNGGLEDLEYWIAAGERGYCGQKIPVTTLLYRRQENSRAYVMKHVKQNFAEMQNKIKTMHAPIYRGEIPDMACGGGCGKSSVTNADPVILSAQNQNREIRVITTLKDRGFDFKENDMEWVAYMGPKKAGGGRVLTPTFNMPIPSTYPNLGNGHYFQIHRRHHKFFEDRQSLGYRINQPDPRQQPEPELPVEIRQPSPQVVPLSQPELSTLVRLDAVGGQTRQAAVQPVKKNDGEVIIEPNAPSSYSATMGNIAVIIDENDPRSIEQDFIDGSATTMAGMGLPQPDIVSLGFGDRINKMLNHDHWTVESLAQANIDDLTAYAGIGVKTASSIIDKAKEYMEQY